MSLLTDYLKACVDQPSLMASMSIPDVVIFCQLVFWLKDEISTATSSPIHHAPPHLPVNIHNFLMAALGLTDEIAKTAWEAFRGMAWEFYTGLNRQEVEHRTEPLIRLFLEYGLPHDVVFYNFRPPFATCQDSLCGQFYGLNRDDLRERPLVEPLSHAITVFTRNLGPIPGRTTSLYCRQCHTRYHPDYYVHTHATKRTYYTQVPAYIHLSQHFYISSEVCEMFANMMAISWTSATNCARFYNTSLHRSDIDALLPVEWVTTMEMTVVYVWDAFLLYSLLLDHAERVTILEVAHDATSHAERLALALRARNVIMAGPGQEMWNHACDLCCWVQPDDEGQMRAVRSVVTDGVTLGHPCCAVHDCKEPIRNTKGARYCMTHVTREKECAVVSCSAPVEDGFTTCTIAAHRALEAFKRLENKAMFQLKHRLDRIRTSQPSSGTSLSTTSSTLQQLELEAQAALLPSLDDPPVGSDELEDDQLEAEIMDAAAECEGKSSDGNVRIRAQFGRRRTHNEELCVASCGIILGRATFYGSEAVNGVLLFWRQLFPTQRALPNVLWHDQNCRLWSMLMNSDAETRQFFDGVALPVDVFHFKCKHKETDIVCGTHCNPYIWPELHTSDGRWRFNSSSAEQINNWFSKYQAIVREMNVDRYNFFLDEMIKRRNRMMVKELERKGARPYSIPREELLCE